MEENSLEKIKKQFNSDKRIKEMLVSYDVNIQSDGVVKDPYEKLREELVFDVAKKYADSDKTRLLDIGCGIGGFVQRCLTADLDAYGIDLAENMVDLAQEQLDSAGHDKERIQLSDIFNFKPEQKFRLLTAIGVIWYYQDKQPFFEKVREFLEPDGLTFIIHRNALFNLYALNQGTIDFLSEHLLSHFPSTTRDEHIEKLKHSAPGIGDPIIKHLSSALHKTYENPLDISKMYEAAGFEVLDIYYAYIHPSPPRLKIEYSPETYRSVHDLYNHAWQGAFMGSQFLVVARKR